jgi:hypothetical protein
LEVNVIESNLKLGKCENTTRYRFLSLYELIRLIVDKSDHQALSEFHRWPLFTFKGEENLTCTKFIERSCQELVQGDRTAGNAFEIAEWAYDSAIDKLSNLKTKSEGKEKFRGGKIQLKRDGSDCRLYFKAVLDWLNKSIKKSPNKGQLELEAETAAAIQSFVKHHIRLSVKEAKRKVNPLWSRYFWNVGGWKICVWLPVYLKGRDRRKWLEKNIGPPDSTKPGEGERIQDQINQKIGNIRMTSLNELVHQEALKSYDYIPDQNENVCASLGAIVAEEKADNINLQRRAIRSLGKRNLKQMVLHIFEKIVTDDYHDIAIAKTYGLSKSTFSRFAGSRWDASKPNIPDLWLNTAQVLSVHPDFKEAAVEAGVWTQVETTLKRIAKQNA